ncbi:MAG: pyrimidine/purine nucleoside phosphorylase [Burkholderiaceae bacterium]
MELSAQFSNVTVVKEANVYFNGKCISHTVILGDGSRKSIGVIFPSLLTFSTGAAEVMEINAGKCRIRVHGDDEWSSYQAGEYFQVPANTRFDIETTDLLDYVCHFG